MTHTHFRAFAIGLALALVLMALYPATEQARPAGVDLKNPDPHLIASTIEVQEKVLGGSVTEIRYGASRR